MPSSTKSSGSHQGASSSRASHQLVRTEIIINVYDLLPPSTLASCLWPLGMSLLHTGVVIDDREYSFGAVNSPGSPERTGVFWTRPRLEPPGATYRCSILQGISFLSAQERRALIRSVSKRFRGSEYDLLSNNCNHFTNYLCRALTRREAPRWINRASGIGKCLPCLVPAEWLDPPEADSGDDSPGGDDADEEADTEDSGDTGEGESAVMLPSRRLSSTSESSVRLKDHAGHVLPASERAPIDRLV